MARRRLRPRLEKVWEFNKAIKAQKKQMDPEAREYLVKGIVGTILECAQTVGMLMDLIKRLPDEQLLDLANAAAIWEAPRPEETLASPQGATKKGVTRLIGNLLMAHPAGQPALKYSKK